MCERLQPYAREADPMCCDGRRLKEKVFAFARSQEATHVVVLDAVYGRCAADSWWGGVGGACVCPTHVITSLDQLAEHDLALPTGFLQPWPMAQCRTERPETTLLFADPAAPPYNLPCADRGAMRTGGGGRGGGAGGGSAADEAQKPRRGAHSMGRSTEAREARKRSLPSSGTSSPGPSKRAAGAGSAASGSASAAAGPGERQGSRRAEEVREELQAVRYEQRDVEIARERLKAKAVRLRLKEQELAAELQQH